MATEQQPYLPLTKFQEDLLTEYLLEKGTGEGYQRTYQRLRDDIGEKRHYALDSDGNIALTDNGDIYEETSSPSVTGQTYNYNNKT